MIDFRENIELLEKMVWNFIINKYSTEDIEYTGGTEDSYPNRETLLLYINSNSFNTEELSESFTYVKKFYNEYKKIPNKDELFKFLQINNSSITREQLDDIYDFDLNTYNYDFLYKYVKAFILIKQLNFTINDLLIYLKTTDINPENIDKITEKVRNDINDKLSIDFNDIEGGTGLNFLNPDHHIQIIKNSVPSGFKFFDKTQGGGWNPKTLVVFQGRPKVGKSIVLGNVATRAFLSGVNTGIVTVELSESKYMKRIGSNILSIPIEEYDNFTDKEKINKIHNKINEIKNNKNIGELIIKEFPTGNATAIDIENYFLRQEKLLSKKFGVIVVDYINLLRPIHAKSPNMYEKIKLISEELRGIAVRNSWCIITATQIKRDSINNFDLGMDSVAESFGLIHTVDALYGLMRNPLEDIMKIKLIANRDNGYEESYINYNINKKYLRLEEMPGQHNVYYSDDDGVEELENEVKKSYERIESDEDINNKNDDTKSESSNNSLNVDYDDILKNI